MSLVSQSHRLFHPTVATSVPATVFAQALPVPAAPTRLVHLFGRSRATFVRTVCRANAAPHDAQQPPSLVEAAMHTRASSIGIAA